MITKAYRKGNIIMKFTGLLRKPLFFACILFVFCLAVGVSAWSSAIRRHQDNIPKTLNRTQSFQIISVVRSGGDYLLSLKNTSNKSINGYSIAIGTKSKISNDLTIGNELILPNGIKEERISVSKIQQVSTETIVAPIILLAAFFEDGTSEGDKQAIADTKGRRQGIKIQLNRILPLLEDAVISRNSNKHVALSKLIERISFLSEEEPGAQSPKVKTGLNHAKQDIVTELQMLDQDDSSFPEGLNRLIENSKKRVARLKD
ncbi:MAG: hypothetical protein ABR577_07085 [Pyrinomonadaceae bacterium]